MNRTNEPEILPFTGPPPAYFDPHPNARNNWHIYRCVVLHSKQLCLLNPHAFIGRQKWTWGRWERIASLGNKAFYVSSTPPPGNLAQGRWGQPPLMLFDYQKLLLGIEFVSYVPPQRPVIMIDGPSCGWKKIRD
jgi:hypothetical protein